MVSRTAPRFRRCLQEVLTDKIVHIALPHNGITYGQTPVVEELLYAYAGNTYGSQLYYYGANMRPITQIWGDDSRGGVEQEVLIKTY